MILTESPNYITKLDKLINEKHDLFTINQLILKANLITFQYYLQTYTDINKWICGHKIVSIVRIINECSNLSNKLPINREQKIIWNGDSNKL